MLGQKLRGPCVWPVCFQLFDSLDDVVDGEAGVVEELSAPAADDFVSAGALLSLELEPEELPLEA